MRRRKIHVRGERGGKAAHFTAAHRIGLAGDREGGRARFADAAGGEVEIDDRIDLIGAGQRLVDPLAEQGDGSRMGGEQIVELLEVGRRNVAAFRG